MADDESPSVGDEDFDGESVETIEAQELPSETETSGYEGDDTDFE